MTNEGERRAYAAGVVGQPLWDGATPNERNMHAMGVMQQNRSAPPAPPALPPKPSAPSSLSNTLSETRGPGPAPVRIDVPELDRFAAGPAPAPVSAERDCPRCAERIKAAALVCRFCGAEFEAGGSPAQAQPEAESQAPRARARGRAPSGRHAAVEAVREIHYHQAAPATGAHAGAAAVLAFFYPGLGHLYCGQIGFGIGLMMVPPALGIFAWILGVGGAVAGGGMGSGYGPPPPGALGGAFAGMAVGVLIGLAFHVWQIFDAYSLASGSGGAALARGPRRAPSLGTARQLSVEDARAKRAKWWRRKK